MQKLIAWRTTILGIMTAISLVSAAAVQFLKSGQLPDAIALLDQIQAVLFGIGGASVGAGLYVAADSNQKK